MPVVRKVNYPLMLILLFAAVILALIYTVSLTQDPEGTSQSMKEGLTVSSEAETKKQTKSTGTGVKDINIIVDSVAIINPLKFTSVEKADKNELVGIALWCILLSQSCESYDFEGKMMLISESRLEQMYTSLFEDISFPGHKTITFSSICFTHNEKNSTYSVPVTSVTPEYTAQIVSKKEKKGKLKITADLIPADNWTQDADGKIVRPKAQQSLNVTVSRKNDGAFTILSVAKK